MKKNSRKWVFLYVLFGTIIFLMLWGIFFFDSKKEDVEQDINKPSVTPVATIIPTSNSDLSYLINDPANSDLSYVSFTVNTGVTISVKDKDGNSVGKTYLDYGPGNPTEEGASYTSPSPLTIFTYAKPSSGTYKIELNSTSSKNFQLDSTFITQDGDIKTEIIKGIVDPEGQVLNLTFDKSNMNNSHIKKMLH